MCCDSGPVAEMLDRYRDLQAGRPVDWGNELGPFIIRFCAPMVVDRARLPGADEGLGGDWDGAVRAALDHPKAGTVVARDGELRAGPRLYALPGRRIRVPVARVGDGGIGISVVDGAGVDVEVDGARVRVADEAPAARLRLHAGLPVRWSVVDDRGGAWFPEGSMTKWDFHGLPFFHGDDVVVDVPAVPLTVSVTRGMEYSVEQTEVSPEPDQEVVVELAPRRLYDAASRGWFGGDLHVHPNYSGDLVTSPHDTAAMQEGEGLHVMNLVAANLQTSRIFDREALEEHAGHDLPWTNAEQVARFGVEYRNDILGHAHALSPSGPPTRYQTGHQRSDNNEDWPPNAVALEELRGLGATVGYTHPVFSKLDQVADAFAYPWSVEARELVVDAALGLVDSMDLLGPNDPVGTTRLYHRLLGCGLRLAATVGTDVFLSFSNALNFSNPPGWARAYADLDGAPLSVAAYQDAVRAGRTFATNGPWLELSVDGHGPGSVIQAERGQQFEIAARWEGVAVERLEIIGPEGPLAAGTNDVVTKVGVHGPMWIAAQATGPQHPTVLGPSVFAHTSPVYVDVDSRRVERAEDARWCLEWLDHFEELVRAHGRFHTDEHRDDVLAVIDGARPFYQRIADQGRLN